MTSLSTFNKLKLLIQIAKIVNTFHKLETHFTAHGSLSPHNIFVSVKNKKDTEEI